MKYLVLLLIWGQFAFAQFKRDHFSVSEKKETAWVDSVYNQMALEDKIGQLFMVAAYSNKDSAHIKSLETLIKTHRIGGLIFFQGGPGRQARLTNHFQSISRVPLFIGIDAEWGLAMRLDSVQRFPWNMTLGAIQDMDLIHKVGIAYGRQANRMGIHFNFAPVLDINTNPKNPIIGNRSFGEDKENVTVRATQLMHGIHSQGVFATGKHFPGHGDTSTDSHHTLPVVNFSRYRIDEVELYPYKKLFAEGLPSVMVAHLEVPAMESREAYPSSLSYNVVSNILQKEMGFKGLIFTDALNMKGASNFKQPGEVDLEAFAAGNDILLFAENVPLAVDKICEALNDSVISYKRLEHSVKKILRYKYKVGLNKYKPISPIHLHQDLNSPQDQALQYELYENAITVLRNKENVLPLRNMEEKIAYVKMGDDAHSPFLSTLQKYTEVVEISEDNTDSLLVRLKPFSRVIVGFHKADGAWKKHDFTARELSRLDSIAKYNKVILDVFAKPYTLLPIKNFEIFDAVVLSYQNSNVAQSVSAQIIFGAVGAKGRLPVSIGKTYPVNFGLDTQTLDVLGFSMPENVGMSSLVLSRIDLVAQRAVDQKMTPGAQVLVARNGKVIYQKSFGRHVYGESAQKVSNTDLYDVASLTKVVSTLPHLLQDYDNGKLKLDTRVGSLLEEFSRTDKQTITVKELLSHYARLQAWEPFYQKTLDSAKRPLERYYRLGYEPGFTTQVAECLYIRDDYRDSILKFIAQSKLLPTKQYKYSDFAFIALGRYLERSRKTPLDVLSNTQFYKPMGMTSTMYNPLHKFDMGVIAPTEVDNYFRHQTLQGYVHDMEAAMEGGVAGHAGIFSNSMDIAKMMQMYLQKGSYGGRRYFSANAFDAFNTCYYCNEGNRRGIGFDKPQLPGTAGPTCGCVSPESFGHTGFTGTMAWADPKSGIVYVFLSNRTFPDSNAPNVLSKENIREDIQKIIQQAIVSPL
jgi:beta-N-acetylhexosaminidase